MQPAVFCADELRDLGDSKSITTRSTQPILVASLTCYTLAIPFWAARWPAIWVFSGALFGLYELISRRTTAQTQAEACATIRLIPESLSSRSETAAYCFSAFGAPPRWSMPWAGSISL